MIPLLRQFRNPGREFRGKPFWSWNGELNARELVRQVRVLKRMGFGGFFMHARIGLDTPYLKKAWFDAIKTSVHEAKRLGLEAWLYDEDRWPSGFAGGWVTQHPEFRQQRLSLRLEDPGTFARTGKEVGVWEARVDQGKLFELREGGRGRLALEGRGRRGSKILAFETVPVMEHTWYNRQTYLDTLSTKAVAEFIKVTHGAYQRHVGSHFGKSIPGVFTDEPHHGTTCDAEISPIFGDGMGVPWTEDLPEVFLKRYGYDLRDHLPELFFDVESRLSRVRRDYHDCLAHLFSTRYIGQLAGWCEKNGLLLTGHVLEEQTPTSQANVVGSAMRSYEFMQAPGVDVLTEGGIGNNWLSAEPRYEYATVKQCASVARQFGRKWVLSELYGCTGWQFPFEAHKAVGDWQAALGVNLRCHHLSWYTMSGEAKRDYPASIFFQSPWWKEYGAVETYFARLGVLLTQGEPVRDLLVIHPVETAWARMKLGWRKDPSLKALDRSFLDLTERLLARHLDFDFGDEEMMSRHACVEDGREGAPVLKLGLARYTAVLLPEMETMRASTWMLLKEFVERGGAMIRIGDSLRNLDCTPKPELVSWLQSRTVRIGRNGRQWESVLSRKIRRISIRAGHGDECRNALYQWRHDATRKRHVIFVCNTDRKRGLTATLAAPLAGRVELWETQTGTKQPISAVPTVGGMEWRLDLSPSGSACFVIHEERPMIRPRSCERSGAQPGAAVPHFLPEDFVSHPVLPRSGWGIERDEPNVLVLDWPEHAIANGKWRKADEVLRVDRAIRRHLKIPLRGSHMCQPWVRRTDLVAKEKGRAGEVRVALRFHFKARRVPSDKLWLVWERPERFAFHLNGRAVAFRPTNGWWTDPCLKRMLLPQGILRRGINTLEATLEYGVEDGLEAGFLLGDFAVGFDRSRPVIFGKCRDLTLGDWTRQGLPFYSGNMTYRCAFHARKTESHLLRVGRWDGVGMVVRVNGQRAGMIAWPPHELDISRWVHTGRNELAIQVLGSRRNSFGPFHHRDKIGPSTGPYSYITRGRLWTDRYQILPYGLHQVAVIAMNRVT